MNYKTWRFLDTSLALIPLYKIFRYYDLLLNLWVDCTLTLMRNWRVILDWQFSILFQISTLSMFTCFCLPKLFRTSLLSCMYLFCVLVLLTRDKIEIVNNVSYVRNRLARSYRICRVLLNFIAIFTTTLILYSWWFLLLLYVVIFLLNPCIY